MVKQTKAQKEAERILNLFNVVNGIIGQGYFDDMSDFNKASVGCDIQYLWHGLEAAYSQGRSDGRDAAKAVSKMPKKQ